MEKILFIVNPIAGDNRANNPIPLIEETMIRENINYEIVQTTRPKEATEITENSPCTKVVAVGGDGTVNEVAKGLIRRKFGILGIIPGGTGNDLSRSLEIPSDLKEALDIIIKGDTVKIDTGLAEGKEFVNIASVGFDADVVYTANKIKDRIKLKGKLAYILGVLSTLLSYKKKQAIIDIDGVIYNRNVLLLAIGNGKYYGGGMKIIPDASLYDGDLHICLVKDISNFKLLFLFPTIFTGEHIKLIKYVEILKGKQVKIDLLEGGYLNLDGDLFKCNKKLKVEISKDKLEVFK